MERNMRERRDLDRRLIGAVIAMVFPRTRGVWTKAGLARETGLSRSTLDRAINATPPDVGADTFARIEGALNLPHRTLSLVGQHNINELVALRAPSDVVDLVRMELAKDEGDSGAAVGG